LLTIRTFSKEGKEDIAGHNKERKMLMKVYWEEVYFMTPSSRWVFIFRQESEYHSPSVC
jgi:hypothetical protein